MEIKGFNENEISEQNKKDLQSETWQKVSKALKTEIQHFTDALEIQHFAVEKFSKNDNAYGVKWGNVIREYLKTAYSEENTQPEVVSEGITYKILKRREVTVFYDADGNTLFDVENKRLEKEYGYVMQENKITAGSEEEINETVKTEHAADEKKNPPADGAETMKLYSSGEEKLIAEESAMIASVKPEFKEVMQTQMDLIFTELIRWTKQDPEFEKKVLLDHKSMKRCMKFCANKAMGLREPSDQEKADARSNNIPIMTPVSSDMLFEWIKEYYDKDDKEEAETEKKVSAIKKKSTEKKKTAPKKSVSKNQEQKPTEKKEETVKPPKKQDKVVTGQMSMFDLLNS